MKGEVIRLVRDKGFGFILGENGVEFFFHRSELRDSNFEGLRDRQKVIFNPTQGPKGSRAEGVYLA